MRYFIQIIFVIGLLALSWLGMMAVHELGHVIGAITTGGSVQRVILHPLTISQTDVDPNPNPIIVVWLGPLVGSLAPLVIWMCIPRRWPQLRKIGQFFAGFCLIANGAYVAFGSIDPLGDAREILACGSPIWMLWTFGGGTISLGLFLWHKLGSIQRFFTDPTTIDPVYAYTLLAVLIIVVVLEWSFSAM